MGNLLVPSNTEQQPVAMCPANGGLSGEKMGENFNVHVVRPTLHRCVPDRVMTRDGTQHRVRPSVATSRQADRVVQSAWLSLPHDHRELLEEIGASQWQTVDRPLGETANRFLRSAGFSPFTDATRSELDGALGVWLPKLRIVLVDVGHPRLADLDQKSQEAFIAHIAWHEWVMH